MFSAATSAQLSRWWNRSAPLPTPGSPGNNSWLSMVTSNNVLVAVGDQTSTLGTRSTNGGVTWSAITFANSTYYTGVAANGATFVAVGGAGYINYSTNSGATWTSAGQPLGSNFSFSGVAYGAGVFVAIGTNYFSNTRQYVTSTDGITWTTRTFPGSGGDGWQAITFGGGKFVTIAAGSGTWFTSTDGITWSSQTGGTTVNSLAYGAGYWVSGTYPNVVGYSTDGLNWTTYTLTPPTGYIRAIGFGNGKFFIPNDCGGYSVPANRVYYATDPTASGNWTSTTLPFTTAILWVIAPVYNTSSSAYSPDFAMLGYDATNTGYASVSSDGITWS
jgi:hypothetical protein